MKQKKAYKYRFYPTEAQKQILARTFGCVRYVYNWALRERTDAYSQRGERLSYEATAERLTSLKKQDDHFWLNEVSSVPLQQALRHLERTFSNFFESRAAYPTFKKKRTDQAATYAASAFKWDGEHLTLVKIDTFYPSSKRCHACGHLLDSLPLDVRDWTCSECGVFHDRDINAAKNVLAAGLAVSACGERVRPGRAKARAGASR